MLQEEAAPTPEAAAPATTPTPAAPAPAPVAAPAGNGNLPGGVKASPVARRMAADNSISIAAIQLAVDPDGRIIKKDVEAYLAAPPAEREAAVAEAAIPAGPALAPLGDLSLGAAIPNQEIPLSRLRGAIGRRMVQSTTSVPHFYVTYEYDLGPLDGHAQAGLMPCWPVLARNCRSMTLCSKPRRSTCATSPTSMPVLDGDRVLHMGHVNLGVAVAVENGLLVVVTHDADRKSLRQISLEVKEKAGRARAGQVHPDDIEGSTFSTSNLGMYGVEDFVAIINPPEAGILALGGAKQVPVVEDGEVTVGWRMKATISVDHRVSDGAEGAEFMQKLKDYLENPVSLML